MSVTLVIRGGTVLDGFGTPGVVADVAIERDRVIAIGSDLELTGVREIDATGLFVAPGFIDAHTHSDVVPFMDEPQPFKLRQGVTTEIVGNCGNSAAPLIDETAVEFHRPISSAARAGVDTHPRSFSDYLDEVEAAGPTNHIASLVGHHTLRINANGMDAALRDGALQRMQDLADEAFAAGAFGLSTGLIYAPGSYADTDEVAALATVAYRWHRPYATHMRDEGHGLADAVAETLEIARRSGVRVQVSHCKAAGLPNHGRGPELLALLHEARTAGVDVYGDQYPYTTGETFLSALLPADMQVGGQDALRAKLESAASRAEWFQLAETGATGAARAGAWHQTTPDGITISMHGDESLQGRTIAEVAADRGVSAWDALCDAVLADPAAMTVYRLMSEHDVRAILADPLIAIGSDNSVPVGYAHQRAWGCFPTVLGAYVRDMPLLPVEEAVRKMTSLTARQFGLTGRGFLAPGAIADVVVFDLDAIGHPGSPTSPAQHPTGIPYVVLAGTVAIDDGVFSGRRDGRVLRAGHPEPRSHPNP
ncbi:D-aminoacylase [Microbacterium schleiferi]|uniref:D-aminoacylase n=1 Tax=Microbacterium schleiferi TaxID=69362 RepID=A0A7S8RHM3_9MICO|nr:D-aminoacylase [Microbacterium schleiferi]QPE04807.1 D-aminoacylase [Microbacterium schleiferi]